MYRMETEIPFFRSGADGKLKLHEAVAMMMDCCQFQEYQEVKFCRYLRENNIAVFLFSMQLDILRMPRFREKVTSAVKIYGCKAIYGLRRMTMRDESGSLCLISNATGAFFDLKAGRAVKLENAEELVHYDEAEVMECLPRKIPIPASGGEEFPACTVHLSALDSNGHLSSPEYFAIAGDVLPENFTYNRVRVEYKQQLKLGEAVIPVRFQLESGGKIIVEMKNAAGTSCAAAEFSTADVGGDR